MEPGDPLVITLSREDDDRRFPRRQDFTAVWTRYEFTKHNDRILRRLQASLMNGDPTPGAIEDEVTLKFLPSTKGDEPQTAPNIRAILCLCNNGESVSCTCRVPNLSFESLPASDRWGYFKKPKDEFAGSMPYNQDWLLQTDDIALKLVKVLDVNDSGIVIFAGATKSGKSDVAKAFVIHAIKRQMEKNAKVPHVVSVEDPIEKWSIVSGDTLDLKPDEQDKKREIDVSDNTQTFGFAMTPRALGRDLLHLGHACKNALRQTPSCFFVGEVRKDEDWDAVMQLAGTGHLVVVTTHAGSITETFSRVFRAMNASFEAERGFVVQRILGIAHLTMKSIENGEESKDIILPRVWRRKNQSVASLVADGLSALVPDPNTLLSRSVFLGRCDDVFNTTFKPDWFKLAKNAARSDDIMTT